MLLEVVASADTLVGPEDGTGRGGRRRRGSGPSVDPAVEGWRESREGKQGWPREWQHLARGHTVKLGTAQGSVLESVGAGTGIQEADLWAGSCPRTGVWLFLHTAGPQFVVVE